MTNNNFGGKIVTNPEWRSVYEKKNIGKDKLFLSGGNLYKSVNSKTKKTSMKAFRGYLELVDMEYYQDNSANISFFVDDDRVTGIEGLPMSNTPIEGIYDLQGRKINVKNNDLNSLNKGIYIIDGKKVTIK